MNDVKFCKDCKWYKWEPLAPICHHIYNANLVNGRYEIICEWARGERGICKKEAKYFEPKEKGDE